jgi:hypothetical protein
VDAEVEEDPATTGSDASGEADHGAEGDLPRGSATPSD